jgi:hypothetical protein
MESPYTKIYSDICDFNHIVEQMRVFVKDLEGMKEKDRSTIDIRLKDCRVSLDKLTYDQINRFENVNEVVNIIENLFTMVKKPKRLKNIDLMMLSILKQYSKMLKERIYGVQIYPKLT